MRILISLFVLLTASLTLATPKNTNFCESKATKSTLDFISVILNRGTPADFKQEVNVKGNQVVKNPRYNLQVHEDYSINVKTVSRIGAKRGMEYRFKVQMFGYQLDPEDSFGCEINSFNLESKEEGVEF